MFFKPLLDVCADDNASLRSEANVVRLPSIGGYKYTFVDYFLKYCCVFVLFLTSLLILFFYLFVVCRISIFKFINKL
jgi:hypothetical protein